MLSLNERTCRFLPPQRFGILACGSADWQESPNQTLDRMTRSVVSYGLKSCDLCALFGVVWFCVRLKSNPGSSR